jgi:hypothetical protein
MALAVAALGGLLVRPTPAVAVEALAVAVEAPTSERRSFDQRAACTSN